MLIIRSSTRRLARPREASVGRSRYEATIRNSQRSFCVAKEVTNDRRKSAAAPQNIGSFLGMVSLLQNEKCFNGGSQFLGKEQCELHGRGIVAAFNGNDGLAGDADHVGQRLLAELAALKSILPDSGLHTLVLGSPFRLQYKQTLQNIKLSLHLDKYDCHE